MPIAQWSMMRFYDPHIDAEAIRFSGISDRGGEFFIREPLAPAGKPRRLQREKALEAITQAIDQGCEPGQVIVE